MANQVVLNTITFEASGAITASGAIVIDNNYYAVVSAFKDLTDEIRRGIRGV